MTVIVQFNLQEQRGGFIPFFVDQGTLRKVPHVAKHTASIFHGIFRWYVRIVLSMRADIGKNVGQDVSGENGYRSRWGTEGVVMVNSFEFVRNSQLRLGTPLIDAKLHDAQFEVMFLRTIPSFTLHRTLDAGGRRWGTGALRGGERGGPIFACRVSLS